MQPEIGMALARQRQAELSRATVRQRPRSARRRRALRWQVTWTRTKLPPQASGTGRPRSSWVIIISPGRPG